jgi:SAM-dependent methyltransferase
VLAWVMADGSAEARAVNDRQRQQFDGLWSESRARPLSPDRIRYRVWARHLCEPIVEVGSGDGLLARTFSSLRILSVDQSTVGLSTTPPPRAVGTMERLPVRSGYARTIVATEVLEHTGDPLAALEECARIARPDGTLLLSVPTLPVAGPEALAARWRTGVWPTGANLATWDPYHERRYRIEELLGQLELTGWEPAEVIPLFGTATTALLFIGEPITRKLFGRTVQLAHHGDRLDRLWAGIDRHSDVAVVARRSRS